MGTLTRKQREICERERRLLDTARAMLIEHGFAGLNMDRLAEATEYSKGTLYQHFCSKEDLVTALAIQSSERRVALLDRARQFSGRPREQMLAVIVADELFARLHPHYFRSELVIKMANLVGRASPCRRDALRQFDRQAFGWIKDIVHAAVTQGDLRLDPPLTVENIVFAMFSLVIGTHASLLNFCEIMQDLSVEAPFSLLRGNLDAMLDGFGWRPFRTRWDYSKSYQRIVHEVFPDESKSVGLV